MTVGHDVEIMEGKPAIHIRNMQFGPDPFVCNDVVFHGPDNMVSISNLHKYTLDRQNNRNNPMSQRLAWITMACRYIYSNI